MSLINWINDGEPIYAKINTSYPRADGSVIDVYNRPLRDVFSQCSLDPDADFPGFAVLVIDTGDPEGVITAPPGRLAFNSTSGTLWIKQSGTGNTGWSQLGGGLTAPQIRTATPIIEVFDLLPGVANATMQRVSRFGQVLGTSTSMFDGNTSGGTSSNGSQLLDNGVHARRMSVTGAGAQSIASSYSTLYGLPIQQQLAAGNVPSAQRTYFQYTFEQTIVVDSQPTGHSFEWGVQNNNDSNSIETFTTRIGIKLIAKPSVNSGNLYLVRRLTSGGALSTIASSSLNPTTPRRLKFIYTEGETPTLAVYIDSTLLHTFSGNADFPDLGPTAGGSGNFFGTCLGEYVAAAGSGTSVLDAWDAHYLVMEQ